MSSSLLSEEQIINGFHTLLQSSLAQARGEGLLTDDELESAEPAIQIAAPSLALFFSALGATGTPPSISSPDSSFTLSSLNCPPSFSNAFKLWQSCVKPIQQLDGDARHDLALVLCDKEPVSSPLRLQVANLASQLKGIGLEILQRRTFQLRFQTDLNVALDSSVRPRLSSESSRSGSRLSSFEPPPLYSQGKPTADTKRSYGALAGEERRYSAARLGERMPPPTREANASEHEENLSVIRETLYSAFADAIVETPSILEQLSKGFTAKAFFASTCLAILEVALTRVEESGVRVVQMGRGVPSLIGINETPTYLRPFLGRLVELTQALQQIALRDDELAIQEASSDSVSQRTTPRIERLKSRLAEGISIEGEGGNEEDLELRMLGNAINELALAMSSLPAFRERQSEAFKVLTAVTSL
ncbi:uncharacterized protein JCM6883_001991 [Sporobolomyces salmoneus]|uniref:uncharacterized protein n=1 Tax=Sporobolomyces salmoneus TaxID=183962 RepID=UPI00317DBFA8